MNLFTSPSRRWEDPALQLNDVGGELRQPFCLTFKYIKNQMRSLGLPFLNKYVEAQHSEQP